MYFFGFSKIKTIPYIVLAGSILINFFIYWRHLEDIKYKDPARFETATAMITSSVANKMSTYRAALYAGAGFFEASGFVDRSEWGDFVKALRVDKNMGGILGIGFCEVIAQPQKKGHIEKLKNEGFADYAVWPKGERGLYAPVLYIEPLNDVNKKALGFDMFFDPVRKEAMTRAATSKEAALSGKVKPLFDNDKKAKSTFIMFVPVYKKKVTLNTPSEINSNLIGFVYAPLSAKELMSETLGGWAEYIQVEAFDGAIARDDHLLFGGDPAQEQIDKLSKTISLELDGRIWTLNFKATDKFFEQTDHHNHLYMLIFGFLASFGLFFIVYLLISLKERAERLTTNMTKQLSTSEERFRLAVDGSSDGIWDWDIETNSLFLSKKWKEMLGYDDEELKNEFNAFYDLLYKEDRPRVMSLVELYFENKIEKYAVEFRMRHKDGSLRWMLARAEAIRTSDGKPYRMAGSHTDITGLKAHETLLETLVEIESAKRIQQEKMLVQQSKMAMMGEMIAAIAHQWRQPLNTLGILIQDVEESYMCGELDEGYIKSFRQKAMDRVCAMSKTIDDFKNFFSPNKRKEKFFIEDAIRESLGMLDSQLRARNINVLFETSDNAKHVFIGYKNELKQVLLNILANAKDAISEKKLKKSFIKISVETCDKDIEIKIEDSAGGIQEDILDLIFDAYFTTKSEDKGTGIGLYMSKRIVEDSMGGKIRAVNTENGAEFTVCLPITPLDDILSDATAF